MWGDHPIQINSSFLFELRLRIWYPSIISRLRLQKGGVSVKIQKSAEDYLETILMLGKKKGNVRSIDIATALSFSKPSVSVAMKNLRENGYILMDRDGFIALTEKGHDIAEKIYERHTLLSSFLMYLGVPKEIAAEDACRLEHVISEESFEALKKHVYTHKEVMELKDEKE